MVDLHTKVTDIMYHFESCLLFSIFKTTKTNGYFPLIVNYEVTREPHCETSRLQFLVDAILFPGHEHRKITTPSIP